MKKYFIMLLLFINCTSRLPLDLGNGYNLNYDRNSYYSVFKDDEIIIEGQIIELYYNSNYILAIVNPIYKLKENMRGRQLSFDAQKKLLETNKLFEYYIVDKNVKSSLILDNNEYSKSNVSVLNNLTDFMIEIKDLGIDKNFKFMEIEDLLKRSENKK